MVCAKPGRPDTSADSGGDPRNASLIVDNAEFVFDDSFEQTIGARSLRPKMHNIPLLIWSCGPRAGVFTHKVVIPTKKVEELILQQKKSWNLLFVPMDFKINTKSIK